MTALDADAVVRRFLSAGAAKDVDTAIDLLPDDVECHDLPIGKVFGPQAVTGRPHRRTSSPPQPSSNG
jgi:hypothetical protein